MMAPPLTPEIRRQAKNQASDTGNAQAMNDKVSAVIIRRNSGTLPNWRAAQRPAIAPIR
jgi:hypothetical protein